MPKPGFDIVRVDPQGDSVMAGHATPGAGVVIRQGEQEVGRATADRSGDWALTPSRQLAPGASALTLAERTPEGHEIKGDGPVLLVLPQPPDAASPAQPNAPAKLNAPAQPALAVLTDGAAAPQVLQGPASPPGSSRLMLGTVDYGDTGAVRFGGTAPPGSTVRVYVDSHPVGDAQANARGSWTMTPGRDLDAGLHQLRLDQLARQGKVSARVEMPFTRAALDAHTLAVGSVVVQPGQNLWLLARHRYGAGIRYTVIYQANRDQIRNPDLIYPGQVFAMPSSDESPPEKTVAGGAMPNASSRSR